MANPNTGKPNTTCPSSVKIDEKGSTCGGSFVWEDVPVHGQRCSRCGLFQAAPVTK